MNKAISFLWFDGQAEAAVNFYRDVFGALTVHNTTHYLENMHRPAGSVMTIEFELFGQHYVAMNGGPQYKLSPSFSIMVLCDDQAEVDRYWDRLAEGGTPLACGWITDQYGLSWQITPTILWELVNGPDRDRTDRVMRAMMTMVKLDVAALRRAAE